MIKINKDLSNIPTSLKPPTQDYFSHPSRPIQQSNTTHLRRQELIDAGEYLNTRKYNDRYKYQDVKDALHALYHKKCAFCEQRIEVPHVEHFRPKSIYYWLAYSWDNLLLACSTCNSNKGNRFEIKGERYNFVFNPDNTYRTIHSSCAELDSTEKPLLVNPEVEDLTTELIFDQKGGVTSNHPRVKHTIIVCALSRDDLKYQRKKILDKFRRDIEAAFLNDDAQKQKNEIGAYVKQFIRKISSSDESFLAFRRYAVDNHWLQKIIGLI